MLRAAFLVLLCLTTSVRADSNKITVKIDEYTKERIDKALDWLASKQNGDGSWSDMPRFPNNVAVTSFAMLGFMSQGHVPNQGKYGSNVSKGLRFLLSQARDDGLIAGPRSGQDMMYCHGIATLTLSQLLGMFNDELVKKTLQKAVKLIIRCQTRDGGINHGGWRYTPFPGQADISVTIMQVMALRSAKDSGMLVPDETMKRALSYINSCYDENTGGYTYMPKNHAPGFARTAAGICVLKLCGEYDKKIDRSIEYLKKEMLQPREHFWYGHYYACHAMHQVGGKDWEDYYNYIRKEFLPAKNRDGYHSQHQQSENGSWSRFDGQGSGPVYQTSVAVIALSVPANYLPIFQR